MRIVLIMVLVGALAAGCKDAKSAQTPTSPGPATTTQSPVRIVQAEPRTRTAVLETTGKVQFNEEQLVRVNAPVTGRVLEVLARPGDVVEPGHRLFVLDSADLGAAKADYAKAVSDVERASAAVKLARELLEAKAIAQKEVREADDDQLKAAAERER